MYTNYRRERERDGVLRDEVWQKEGGGNWGIKGRKTGGGVQMEGGSLLLRRRGTENHPNKSQMDGGQRAAGGEGGGSLRLSRLSAGTTRCQGRVVNPVIIKWRFRNIQTDDIQTGKCTFSNDWMLQQLLHQSAAEYGVIKFRTERLAQLCTFGLELLRRPLNMESIVGAEKTEEATATRALNDVNPTSNWRKSFVSPSSETLFINMLTILQNNNSSCRTQICLDRYFTVIN